MIVTSFKTMEEIRQGNLFSLPSALNFEAWDVAWNGQGFSAGDVFLKTYFWNSVKLVVLAVIISTILGAINGYALTKWRFKGDSYIFLLFCLELSFLTKQYFYQCLEHLEVWVFQIRYTV